MKRNNKVYLTLLFLSGFLFGVCLFELVTQRTLVWFVGVIITAVAANFLYRKHKKSEK